MIPAGDWTFWNRAIYLDPKPAYTGPNGPEWPPAWEDPLAQVLEELVLTPDAFGWTQHELDDATRLAHRMVHDVKPSQDPNAIAHRIKRHERELQDQH